ncbi:methyltransferase [Streptomyces sp. CBMA123]|uniref:methyltransferase n=1 Tax=Streptomyces sp. CBMA123 TaxID=1896313 RepID=UPI001661B412|nr:methyltransferase [Streptomyces sp. CBMA123]MBD0693803.1 hydroxyneurosporene methyltransferase [Streptomyces sp. CBMA123]
MIPADLERAVYGMYATHALRIADRHGVFEYLTRHSGESAGKIAAALTVDEDTLERLLLVLSAFGVLDAEGGCYALAADVRPYVDRADPRYLMGFVDHLIDDTAGQFGQLSGYLHVGKVETDRDEPAPFEAIYRDDESVGRFLGAMWGLSHHVSHELAALADLSGARQLIDVGGASGPFSVAALQAFPQLRSTVFDLPQVGPHLAARSAEHGLDDRLAFTAGDFFHDPLPAGDCFAFGYILSDWDDQTCATLLRKAYEACLPGGRVLIMERLFDDDRGGPLATAVMNLSMHIETQGRHRTAAEYLDLLRQAGFADGTVRRSSGDKHLIIGRRATSGSER